MTTGCGPRAALATVWTWFTETDCWSLPPGRPAILFSLGLPPGGWVALELESMDPHMRKAVAKEYRKADRPMAITLDEAEETGHPRIHPGYKKWQACYQGVTYGNKIELVADDGSVTVIK
jgi:hypothetical protein